MNTYFKHFFAAIFLLLIVTACNEKKKDADFIIPEKNPAAAFTIGWYLPVESLVELVGPGFRPKIVNDKNEAAIMLYIVSGKEHLLEGVASGPVEAAHLVIPVETTEVSGEGGKMENKLVCPMTIVEQSLQLGDQFNGLGFSTYSGHIELDIRHTGEKYMVESKISTLNGNIEIIGMFEEKGHKLEMSSAVFNPKPGSKSYFFGDERMERFDNGKGNLNTEGENIIEAMGLGGRPFFLKLDVDLSWEFDFVR